MIVIMLMIMIMLMIVIKKNDLSEILVLKIHLCHRTVLRMIMLMIVIRIMIMIMLMIVIMRDVFANNSWYQNSFVPPHSLIF